MAAVVDGADPGRSVLANLSPGNLLSEERAGGRVAVMSGGGGSRLLCGLWVRLLCLGVCISSSQIFSAGLCTPIKNLCFPLAQRLGETPLCALRALRPTQHFPELESMMLEARMLQNCSSADVDRFHTRLCSTTFQCEL